MPLMFFPCCYVLPDLSASAPPTPPQDRPPLKIVHAGGIAEYYHRPVQASRIMDKYPAFILTRPTIFRRPWESLVGPREMLTPGEKYYVVPRGTVRKLRRRIRRPAGVKSISDKPVAADRPTSNPVSKQRSHWQQLQQHKDKGPSRSTRPTARNQQHGKAASSASKTTASSDSKGSYPFIFRRKVSSKSVRESTKDPRVRSSDTKIPSSIAKCSEKKRDTSFHLNWSPSLPTISELSLSSSSTASPTAFSLVQYIY